MKSLDLNSDLSYSQDPVLPSITCHTLSSSHMSSESPINTDQYLIYNREINNVIEKGEKTAFWNRCDRVTRESIMKEGTL